MVTGEHSFTPAGNMRASDKLTCLQWVVKGWKAVSTELIIKSFKVCGISVAVDGTEDDQIHCLKPGGTASEAAPELSWLTTEMQTMKMTTKLTTRLLARMKMNSIQMS